MKVIIKRDFSDSYRQDDRQDGCSIYIKWLDIPNVVERDISDSYRQDDRRKDRQDGCLIYKNGKAYQTWANDTHFSLVRWYFSQIHRRQIFFRGEP